MKKELLPKAEQYAKQNKRKSIWRKLVRTMACFVVFCTTYALILPAITMERQLCEVEEHTHSDSCYVKLTTREATRLACDYDTLEVHEHGPECLDADGKLVCGLADYVVHEHDASCRDANGALMCILPEIKEHEHTEECYQAEEAEEHVHDETCYTIRLGELVCELTETEGHTHTDECKIRGDLVCGQDESEGHAHGEACSETVLVCDLTVEPHVHGDSCWTQLVCELTEDENHAHSEECSGVVLNCDLTEQAHVHGDGCYQTNLLCDLPESAGHSHDDSCYAVAYICGLEESEGHSHEDSCYEQVEELTCQPEETEPTEPTEPELICEEAVIKLHTHDEDDCYEIYLDEDEEEQKRLICEEIVVEEHIHSEACFVTEEVPLENVEELTCGQEEGEAHTHTERCYGSWELVCGKEEHAHKEECTPEPETTYYCAMEAHSHSEECLDEEGNLICELEEHVHTEECLREPQLVTLDQDGAVVSELTYTGFGIQRSEKSEDVEGNTVHAGDTVFFDITVDLASYDETVYHQGRVKMEFVLPYAAEQAIFDLTQMPWLDSSEGYAPVVIVGEEIIGEETITTQKLTGYYLLQTNDWNSGVIPGGFTASAAVKVLDIPHNETLMLSVSAAMEHNAWEGICQTHQLEEKLTIVTEEVTVSNMLSEEEQKKLFEAYMAQLEELEAQYDSGEDVLEEGEALQLAVGESYDKGHLSEERFRELNGWILQLLEKYYGAVAEVAVGTNWMRLRDSGWFEEYSNSAPMLFSAMSRSASNVLYETLEDVEDPSDVQVKAAGGTNADEKVTISKTINGTDLENVFDITLTVTTQEEIVEIIQEPDMAVVIVMDISQTMNTDFGDTTRYKAAMTAAENFVDKFAEETAGVSKLGYVAFNTSAHQIVGLSSCGSAAEANTIKNTIRTQTGNIINASGYKSSGTRFTNVEAGLKMGYDMLASATNENKYIIFLSDGFPTTYIKSGYTGYDPEGEWRQFFDGVRDVYCSGTSYSDTAAVRARNVASTIKSAGVNIFSIGVDVGGQSVQKYIDRGHSDDGVKQWNSDGTPKWLTFSVVECGDGTVKGTPWESYTYVYDFEIGVDQGSYENWLRNSIGSGYYYASTDSAGLQAAYDEIFEEIQSMNAAAAEADWVAEDPMPVVNDVNYVEFIGFYNQSGTLADGDLSGTSGVGTENTADFDSVTTTIDWDLKKSGYTKTTSGNISTYAYKLMYRVRLKNELDPFTEDAIFNTNATTFLTYNTFEEVDGNTTVSEDKRLDFPIPSVHGYLSELTFQKKDNFGRPVEGAEFTLSHDTENCTVCRGNGTAVSVASQTKISDQAGLITFAEIPSGHKYTLVETKVPDGYSANGETYSVTVAYDVLTVTAKDRNGNVAEWTGEVINNTSYELPNTGGAGTYLYTVGGLLLMMAAAVLLYIQTTKRRKEEMSSF